MALPSSYLDSTTSYYGGGPGKHFFDQLVVSNTASATKRFALYFRAGPLKSLHTSTFRVLPRSITVGENRRRNVGYLGLESYVSGSSLGSYSVILTSYTSSYVLGVDQ